MGRPDLDALQREYEALNANEPWSDEVGARCARFTMHYPAMRDELKRLREIAKAAEKLTISRHERTPSYHPRVIGVDHNVYEEFCAALAKHTDSTPDPNTEGS